MKKAQQPKFTKLQPIFIIVSQEQFFTDKSIASIKQLLITAAGSEDQIEFESLDAQNSSIEDIIGLANTYPFLAQKRCITVRNFDALFQSSKEQKNALSLLQTYFDEPADFTVLICIADKLDKRLKLIKQAAAAGLVFEFSQPNERDLPLIIKTQVKELYSKQIDDHAVMLLCELVGVNLDALNHELEKLDLFTGEVQCITAEHVGQMVGNSALVDNFKMVDMLASKNASASLHMLQQLLNHHQEPPERLLGLLKWQFRRLLNAKLDLERGVPMSEVFSKHKVFHFHQQKFRDQLNMFSLADLQRIYFILFQTDRTMKTTGLSATFLLEQFFYKLLTA